MSHPQHARSEAETLLAYLGHLRSEVVRTLRDLDEEQARRPGVPSGTSLIATSADVCP